jgi:hypothetical protein
MPTVHAYILSNLLPFPVDFGDGNQPMSATYALVRKTGEFKWSLWVYMDYGNDVCMIPFQNSGSMVG